VHLRCFTAVLGLFLSSAAVTPAFAADAAPPAPKPVAPAPAPAAGNALDYTAEARVLFRVAACAGQEALPANVSAKLAKDYCAAIDLRKQRYHKGWLAKARPFFDNLVPKGLPTTVVYPFGGGDLLGALVVYPQATEITAISLEPAGDPRSIRTLKGADLEAGLAEQKHLIAHLLSIGHSKTADMSKAAKEQLPSQLIMALAALSALDMEPVGLRYFRLGPAGEVQYLTQADLDAAPNEKARGHLFESYELTFRPAGGGDTKVFRHIKANLADDHLPKDSPVLRHLEAKGKVSGMTKAASYLLWWDSFSRIRTYLLDHVQWMVSDSTGIPPQYTKPAGFEQVAYGRFVDGFFKQGKKPTEDFRAVWKNPAGPMNFLFGYPDSVGNRHLLVTRRTSP
jgi:hypothetical protein